MVSVARPSLLRNIAWPLYVPGMSNEPAITLSDVLNQTGHTPDDVTCHDSMISATCTACGRQQSLTVLTVERLGVGAVRYRCQYDNEVLLAINDPEPLPPGVKSYLWRGKSSVEYDVMPFGIIDLHFPGAAGPIRMGGLNPGGQ